MASDPPWRFHESLRSALKEARNRGLGRFWLRDSLESKIFYDILYFISTELNFYLPVGPLLLVALREALAMPLIADLQVLPSPPGTGKEKWKHVDAAIKVISASKLKYSVNALGTVVEGPAAKVWSVCRLGASI